jgi:von Willebrand factor type A domain
MRHALWIAVLALAHWAWSQECKQAVPAIILDEKARTFISTVTAEQLQAKVGGVLVPVTSVEPITTSRVLILIDDSGSMEGNRVGSGFSYQEQALAQVNRALKELVNDLPGGFQVEYGIFHNRAIFGGRFSSDPKELSDSLAEVAARLGHPKMRKTALYDAIHEGLAQFDSPRPGDSILVLTDGEDNASILSAEKLQREAAGKGVRLFTILIKKKAPFSPEELSAGLVFDFAERTGGSVHIIDAGTALWLSDKASERERQDLRRFWAEEVVSGYVLHFAMPPGSKKDQKWTLSVSRAANPKGRIVAAYPSHLRPCPLTTAAAH